MSGNFNAFDDSPEPSEENVGWDYEHSAMSMADILGNLKKYIEEVPTFTFITQEQKDALVADLQADAKAMVEQYMKRHNNGTPKTDETTN